MLSELTECCQSSWSVVRAHGVCPACVSDTEQLANRHGTALFLNGIVSEAG